MTMADNVPSQKVMDSVRKRVEKKGGTVVDTIGFTAKVLAAVGEEHRAAKVLSRDEIREPLRNWLKDNQIF